MSHLQQYDAIVIGSGIGGLTVAAILSKFNHQKVLVLEQHFILGGFTQEFKRQNFQWDVGLHYVGDMGEGESGRLISDYITDGRLKWAKIPDPFETSVYPDFTFEVYSDPNRYQADLIQKFPEEKAGIVRYFADLRWFGRWHGLRQATGFLPGRLGAIAQSLVNSFGKTFLQTTKDYLDQHFRNPQLKALLASAWGTYGLPPSESIFSIHALVMSSYLKGGWYPVGGAQEIAKQILPVIEQAGGQAIIQRQVTEIIVENGVAIGVKARKTHDPDAAIKAYYAPVVFSDAGAFNTYTKLLPIGERTIYGNAIQRFPKGHSVLLLFLGLKASPQTIGFQGGHHWVYSSYDHDTAWQLQRVLPEQGINSCFLSFPSLNDPTAQSHTAEVMVYADYECFTQWQEQPWRKRDADYYALKDRITQRIVDFLEGHYPGFKDLIEFADLSTPLTIAYFDASDRGAIYGIPFVPDRLQQPWVGVKTPIQNLYLTGADALGPGIMGAAFGGVMAAAAVNGGSGFPRIMAAMRQEAAQKQAHTFPLR
ncbi:MAG: NAD(P)/FAD-dependent oxidoreductase [Hyellaceae cyanobacterium CSU_1_1]|nr:NAD(P)/FAD-dependent oxidoreductase [Hyellaceae cyanobacterium CSU_1_1]